LRKPSHTHALHELSLLLKKLCLQEIYAHWLLNSFLYACVFLTSYLTVFTGLDTCVSWFLVEDLTLFFSLLFDFGYGFSLILCLSFVLLRQEGGLFFVLDRECISKLVKCFFVPEWPKGKFFSILCWQHSGWQKYFM